MSTDQKVGPKTLLCYSKANNIKAVLLFRHSIEGSEELAEKSSLFLFPWWFRQVVHFRNQSNLAYLFQDVSRTIKLLHQPTLRLLRTGPEDTGGCLKPVFLPPSPAGRHWENCITCSVFQSSVWPDSKTSPRLWGGLRASKKIPAALHLGAACT